MIDEINTVWFEYKLIEYKINFYESLSYLHCINNKYNKTKGNCEQELIIIMRL